LTKTCNYKYSENTFPYFYITGKNVKNKWKHLRDNFLAELNRMNANKSGDPGLSPHKRECQWRWFKMLLFFEKYFEC